MQVIEKGEGEPEIAVVGSLHGDEPCGKKTIEKFLSDDWKFQKPVKFIIANEKALEKDERFLDTDLNRCFPGDKSSDLHEEKLAAKLLKELEGKTVLDIHSTKSYPEPFSILSSLDEKTKRLCTFASVENTIYFPDSSGTMHSQPELDAIIVEAGYQKTEKAVKNAYKVLKNFLAALGAINTEYETSNPDFFQYEETVEGNYNFLAENFKKVKKGEVYAENGEEKIKAAKEFYPVLMSTNGYSDMLGFKAQKITGIEKQG